VLSSPKKSVGWQENRAHQNAKGYGAGDPARETQEMGGGGEERSKSWELGETNDRTTDHCGNSMAQPCISAMNSDCTHLKRAIEAYHN